MAIKILLVDDDADEAELFKEALLEIDPTIVCFAAMHGRQACELLQQQHGTPPDLIFLDINMPVMDGWQCLSSLKNNELLKEIPVIMYSTSTHKRDKEQASTQGAIYFLTKPNDYPGLREVLKSVITHLQQRSLDQLDPSKKR